MNDDLTNVNLGLASFQALKFTMSITQEFPFCNLHKIYQN